MLHYESLIHVEREEIYQAFLKAFSDYQVRGGLVGFILNGCRKWNGKSYGI